MHKRLFVLEEDIPEVLRSINRNVFLGNDEPKSFGKIPLAFMSGVKATQTIIKAFQF